MKLTIKNFLCYKNSSFEIDEWVNVLSGPTGAGKSSVIKAIRWLVTDEIKGDKFTPPWKGTTEVKWEFEDGSYIARFYSKSKKGYRIKRAGEDEVVYTGVGRDKNIQKEIDEFINIRRFQLNTQFAQRFMIFDSESERAKTINSLSGMDIIDSTMATARSIQADARSKAASAKKEYDRSIFNSKKFVNVPEIVNVYNSIAKEAEEAEELKARGDAIYKLIQEIKMYTFTKPVHDLDAIINEIKVLIEQSKEIEKLDAVYRQVSEEVRRIDRLGRFTKHEPMVLSDRIKNGIRFHDNVRLQREHVRTLKEAIDAISRCESVTKSCELAISNLNAEIKDTIGDFCPICKRPMEGYTHE